MKYLLYDLYAVLHVLYSACSICPMPGQLYCIHSILSNSSNQKIIVFASHTTSVSVNYLITSQIQELLL